VINFSKLLYYFPLAVFTSSSPLLCLYPFYLPLSFPSLCPSVSQSVLYYPVRLIFPGVHKATKSLKIEL